MLLFASSTPNPEERRNFLLVGQLRAVARQLGMSLVVAGIGSGADIEGAFATLRSERSQALFAQASAVTIDNRSRIVELAARQRMPAMYETEGFVEAGGLLSYGPSLAAMYRRAADCVDRILTGAKPADLPVELPSKYDLVINMQTAKALDLQIPQVIPLRADRLIE